MPPEVSVGGYPWTLQVVPHADLPDAYGTACEDSLRISIREGQRGPVLADTALHEVMHAILRSQGRVYGGVTEERYVRPLATGLVGFLRSNPQFTQWLLQEVNT